MLIITLQVLLTLIAEVEAMLHVNDWLLAYDLEPLTPSHLLYRWRITMLPYPIIEGNSQPLYPV